MGVEHTGTLDRTSSLAIDFKNHAILRTVEPFVAGFAVFHFKAVDSPTAFAQRFSRVTALSHSAKSRAHLPALSCMRQNLSLLKNKAPECDFQRSITIKRYAEAKCKNSMRQDACCCVRV